MNEAFIIDGGVNYDILTWPMERQADRRVLARIMSYEYLWHTSVRWAALTAPEC